MEKSFIRVLFLPSVRYPRFLRCLRKRDYPRARAHRKRNCSVDTSKLPLLSNSYVSRASDIGFSLSSLRRHVYRAAFEKKINLKSGFFSVEKGSLEMSSSLSASFPNCRDSRRRERERLKQRAHLFTKNKKHLARHALRCAQTDHSCISLASKSKVPRQVAPLHCCAQRSRD